LFGKVRIIGPWFQAVLLIFQQKASKFIHCFMMVLLSLLESTAHYRSENNYL